MTGRAFVSVSMLSMLLTSVAATVQPFEGCAWGDAPFIVGAPGRLDSEGDRREPRRYLRDDSAVGAYADVEEVADPLWLQHEIEAYARRGLDCAGQASPWCRREQRRIEGASVVLISSGVRAEIVWLSGLSRAVRLGWRRIVATPTGSMTVDSPPREFAAAMLAAFPSRLRPVDLADSDAWARAEIDRLLYYADQVVAGLGDVEGEAPRRHAVRFIEDNLGRVAQLGALHPTLGVGGDDAHAFVLDSAEELAALRAWRSGAPTPRLCAAPAIAAMPGSLMSSLEPGP
jgi:hypothetical protein